MRACVACGGVLGRDCFNEQDCIAISNSYYEPENNLDFHAMANRYIQALLNKGIELNSEQQKILTNEFIDILNAEIY